MTSTAVVDGDERRTRYPIGPARFLYGSGSVLLAAFAVFEMVKHGPVTAACGAFGALLPPIVGAVTASRGRERGHGASSRARAVANGMTPPALVLLLAATLPESNVQAAPWWTLGLTWLCHLTTLRALGRRPRNTPAAAPSP